MMEQLSEYKAKLQKFEDKRKELLKFLPKEF